MLGGELLLLVSQHMHVEDLFHTQWPKRGLIIVPKKFLWMNSNIIMCHGCMVGGVESETKMQVDSRLRHSHDWDGCWRSSATHRHTHSNEMRNGPTCVADRALNGGEAQASICPCQTFLPACHLRDDWIWICTAILPSFTLKSPVGL